ncbi:hypothetical protein STEG23_033147 [Scotinomys teguina]
MKFAGKWKELENIILSEVTQTQKDKYARIQSTILNRHGEIKHPCLVPNFSGIVLSFSPFSLMLAVGLLYITFIMFRQMDFTDIKCFDYYVVRGLSFDPDYLVFS